MKPFRAFNLLPDKPDIAKAKARVLMTPGFCRWENYVKYTLIFSLIP